MLKDYESLVRHGDNASLFQAVEMSIFAAENRMPLHIHAEGLRGTGKTSIMRAAKNVLPYILRIKNCLYNCDPQAPHCPDHRGLDAAVIEELGSEWIPMPFLEISHAAKVATVVGGIDLEKLVSKNCPEAAVLPGTLAQAHRGIVFVDEINRLADTAPELADVLLDVMGTKPGRLQIEDTGLPAIEMRSLVTIWAASNPDEDPGPLEGIRRQLADRFDLVIDVCRPKTHAALMAILKAMNRGEPDAIARNAKVASLRGSTGKNRIEVKEIAPSLLSFLANMYLGHGLESLRALEAITLAAKVHAALAGRYEVDETDLKTVIPLALKHRTPPHILADIMQELGQQQPAEEKIENAGPLPIPAGTNSVAPTGLFGRLFGSFKEASPEKEMESIVVPISNPLGQDEGRAQTRAESSTSDLIPVTAPPHAAQSIEQVKKTRLLMGEAELNRDQ